MVVRICPECEREILDKDFTCPHCRSPVETLTAAEGKKEISTTGMLCLIALFVLFPVVLFLIHIFVPGM